jgi:hypothetical protein
MYFFIWLLLNVQWNKGWYVTLYDVTMFKTIIVTAYDIQCAGNGGSQIRKNYYTLMPQWERVQEKTRRKEGKTSCRKFLQMEQYDKCHRWYWEIMLLLRTFGWQKEAKDSWILMMEPIGCPKTSARNYHYSLRNNPEEHISQILIFV